MKEKQIVSFFEKFNKILLEEFLNKRNKFK